MDERPTEQITPEMSLEAPQHKVLDPDAQEGRAGQAPCSPTGEAKARDHESVRLALAGDERGFAELYSRYERRAWRVARNLVPSDEDAQDLVQDAFLRVFKSLERFDFSHAFSTWLYRIVTNLAIDLLRKRRPSYSTTSAEEDESDQELVDERVEDPSQSMLREETANEVRNCLQVLAPHFQSALVLRELEGLPCNEIADIVGATHVTVRWRLHRGRKLFQEEWERREREQESGLRSNGSCEPTVQSGGEAASLEASSLPLADSSRDPSRKARERARGSEKTGPEE